MNYEYDALDTGGSVGSLKGNYYENHFALVLLRLGYKIVSSTEYKKYIALPNIVFHKYRTAPDQFTEIDFFIPSKKIGFWVTNIGQTERYKEKNSSKSFNEFSDLKGNCPHCKKAILPNSENEIISKWTCNNCKRVVSPFDLINKKSISGQEVIKDYNKSAMTQAHKQAYYRIGEYIEARTSDDRVSCIEVIYNNRTEWRNWSHAIELFFDNTIFIFDEFKDTFGSDKFEKELTTKVKNLITSPPQPNKIIKEIISKADEIRENKLRLYPTWIKNISNSREKYWGDDEPISFPIRYSLYGLLKSYGSFKKEFDVYTYAVLIKIKSDKLILSSLSSKEKRLIPTMIKKGLISNDLKIVTKEGRAYLNYCVNQYREVIKQIQMGKLTHKQKKDLWFPDKKPLIIEVLTDLLNESIKNDWYKFIMISAYDYIELNNTPYINEQFEPLETLTYIYLRNFKKHGIIKEVFGEPGIDHKEKTWLSDMPFAKTRDFMLGTDVEIELNNGKKVFIQCKSNTSFKKWEKNSDNIKNSGIPYKDSKRMIAHNFISSFKFSSNSLKHNSERIYIGILDGNWCATTKDIYRTIKLMYLLGVDEIFFADEFETRLKDYLIKISH